jgi:O-antigen/teichoic acid export membrane protein
MSKTGLSRWVPLLASFSAGQAAILVINLVTGFLILRLLSIEEYAIYMIASTLQALGSVGTDLGMSQGLVSIGAPLREDKEALGRLVRAAAMLRSRLFLVVVPLVLVAAYLLMRRAPIDPMSFAAVTTVVLLSAWVQQSAAIDTAVLNANHEARALVKAGLGTAMVRMLLVISVCAAAPYAIAALATNLIGSLANVALLRRRSAKLFEHVGSAGSEDFSRQLMAFVKPLLPGTLYYLVYGHVSTFLLGIAGITVAIAEVGALGRLGQIVGVLLLFNGVFIQPYFARLQDRKQYASRALQVVAVLASACFAITVSAVALPQAWLALLGANYAGLEEELLIALAGAQLSTVTIVLYTMVIATRRTEGQWLQIPFGLAVQAAFVLTHGVGNTRDALILNVLPLTTSFAIECGLLAYVIASWRTRHSGGSKT